jgi:hypothetical protein
VVENNDPTLGGSPITPVIGRPARTRRRGVKTIVSDNVFDENLCFVQGDFAPTPTTLLRMVVGPTMATERAAIRLLK